MGTHQIPTALAIEISKNAAKSQDEGRREHKRRNKHEDEGQLAEWRPASVTGPRPKPPTGPPPSAGVLARYTRAYAKELGVRESRVRVSISYRDTAPQEP